jgi:hypothetical protein
MAELCPQSTFISSEIPRNPHDRKSKMVSFRLSPEEYRQFRNACSEHGVRSVSELARTAMQSLVEAKGSAVPLYVQVRELRERMTVLSTELDRLGVLVEPPEAAAALE